MIINIDGSLNSKVFCFHIFNILTLHNCKKRKKEKGQLHVSPGDVISSRDEGVTRIDFLGTYFLPVSKCVPLLKKCIGCI